MTLLILAAGLGSRYGGLKQLSPVTNEGDFIIDFSVFDAIRAGFDKIVFVIKEENLSAFRESIGKRFEKKVQVEYAFQRTDDLPAGAKVNPARSKPWGTAHAVLAARELISEPFAVINADDFYGRSAYTALARHLLTAGDAKGYASYCMVGYPLKNTLTENGTVSRGVCTVENGFLCNVTERTAIKKTEGGAAYTEDGKDYPLHPDTVVSMNCWGFTPDIFARLERGFAAFLKENGEDLKREYYLPSAVTEIMERGDCTVRVYASTDEWYGVTYREDHAAVVESLAKLMQNGAYPQKLHATEE